MRVGSPCSSLFLQLDLWDSRDQPRVLPIRPASVTSRVEQRLTLTSGVLPVLSKIWEVFTTEFETLGRAYTHYFFGMDQQRPGDKRIPHLRKAFFICESYIRSVEVPPNQAALELKDLADVELRKLNKASNNEP